MVDYLSVIVENLTGFDPLKDTRKRGNVEARVLLANALLTMGMTETATGDLLGKNHSTIHYYRDLLKDLPGLQKNFDRLKKILDL